MNETAQPSNTGPGRVALGGCPPRAPTDPYVDTLDHTVPQVTPSLHQRHDAAANPSIAIRWRFGNTAREFKASQVFLAIGVVTRCLASRPPGPRGSSSPASTVLSRHCDFLPAIPPHFVAFAWRYHGNTHVSLPPSMRVATSGLGLVTRCPRPGSLPWRRQDLPSSWGTPIPVCPCSSTPAGQCVPDHLQDTRLAPVTGTTKAPTTSDFRGSIAWLSGSPPTYHDVGYPSPRKAGFQVLVRLSWTGFHPQGSCKRFSTHFMCVGLLFQASWHNPVFRFQNKDSRPLKTSP
jgi:hypothetical protein